MTTQLYPLKNSPNKASNAIKIKIDCQERITPTTPLTEDWLELTRKIDHTSSDFKIYEGLLEKRNHIVAKIGPRKLDEEYAIGKRLEVLKLPTFITFHCIFKCLDDFSAMNNLTKQVCKKDGNQVTVLIMPFLSEGRIDTWKWTRENFNLMKNIMKHAIKTLFHAKNTLEFIHADTNLGNILLKKTKRKTISYGDFGDLEVFGLIPVFMDFERSQFVDNNIVKFYRDIEKIISLMSCETNVKYNGNRVLDILSKFISDKTPISNDICEIICNEIDALQIRSVVSEDTF